MQHGKLFAALLSLEGKLDNIRRAAPAYQLSEELKVQYHSVTPNVLLTTNIRPTSTTTATRCSFP